MNERNLFCKFSAIIIYIYGYSVNAISSGDHLMRYCDKRASNIDTNPEFCIHGSPEGHEFSILGHNNSFRPLRNIKSIWRTLSGCVPFFLNIFLCKFSCSKCNLVSHMDAEEDKQGFTELVTCSNSSHNIM